MPKRIDHKKVENKELKWCFKCKKWLPLKSFRLNNAKWDKLDGFCSECARKINESDRRFRGVLKRDDIYKSINGVDCKRCLSCKCWKPLPEFRKAKGTYLQSRCKECCKLEYVTNKEQAASNSKVYRLKNRDRLRQSFKQYWQDNVKELRKKSNVRAKLRYEQYKDDPIFRVHASIASGIWRRLRSNKKGFKNELRSTEKDLISIVGYDYTTLKYHLELQFESWMTWSNYGNKDIYNTWSIDHILAVSSFKDLSFGSDDFKKCWALENLRPLRTVENIAKKNYIIQPAELKVILDKTKMAAYLAYAMFNKSGE